MWGAIQAHHLTSPTPEPSTTGFTPGWLAGRVHELAVDVRAAASDGSAAHQLAGHLLVTAGLLRDAIDTHSEDGPGRG